MPSRHALAAALSAVLAAAGCAHPVGPARTFGKYEGKARTTVESALSNVQTVLLAAKTAAGGNAFGPYTSVVVSDAEESLSGLQGTFGSIQPPDADADDLRDEVDDLLSSALDHVTDVRVAVRRGELHELDDQAQPLLGDVNGMESFLEEHA